MYLLYFGKNLFLDIKSEMECRLLKYFVKILKLKILCSRKLDRCFIDYEFIRSFKYRQLKLLRLPSNRIE